MSESAKRFNQALRFRWPHSATDSRLSILGIPFDIELFWWEANAEEEE